MNYTLRGSISRTQPYQLDPTLTVEGAGAEAKATGEAIKGVRDEVNAHAGNASNPHNVTKEQLGLSEVDNTSDMDKPVSYAQEIAIADAKKAGTDAYAYAEEIMGIVNENKTSSDEAGGKAENAQTSADEAMTAAQKAQETADSKTAWFAKTVTLTSDGWNEHNQQVVTVEGVTSNQNQPIFISPETDSEESYNSFDVKPSAQGENQITFSCNEVPDSDIILNIVGFTLPKEV